MASGNVAVSIVLPTLNRAALLGATIDSIRAQTFSDWELLVVDDGSTDGTESVVRGCGDPRVVYLRNEGKHGVAPARNLALGRARGEFVAFQDAGELWPPEKLAVQVEAMRRLPADVGLVYGNYVIHRLNGTRKLIRPAVFNADDKDTARRALGLDVTSIDTPTWLVRAAVFAECGKFDEDLKRREDTEFLLRLALHSFRFQYIDALTLISYERTESLSSNADTLLAAHDHIVKRYADQLPESLMAAHYRSLGQILIGLNPPRLKTARSFLLRAMRPPHGRPSDLFWLLLSLGGKPAYDFACAVSSLRYRLGLVKAPDDRTREIPQ